ncbi:MAG: anti-sigma factor antagonist [Oligoflexales bacterium]|nr:anti-sigma factor antagonist [Oligoflexales bacterium]
MITMDLINSHTAKLIFSGFISEKWEFTLDQLPSGIRELVIDSKDVRAISSLGISIWIKFFTPLREKGVQIRFVNCSPILIQQGAMLLSNFIYANEVVNVGLPYYCGDCENETTLFLEISELAKNNFSPPAIICNHCNSHNIEFDDDENQYFQLFNNPLKKAT